MMTYYASRSRNYTGLTYPALPDLFKENIDDCATQASIKFRSQLNLKL
jgi:hypothetical protein